MYMRIPEGEGEAYPPVNESAERRIPVKRGADLACAGVLLVQPLMVAYTRR
jgi:hypothetical protein